jgi:predicted phosphodiesterase
MRTVKITLPRTLKTLDIHVFSDWHIGDKHCDMAGIRNSINQVKANPNAYVILNGDLLNNATKTSVSDCYAEQFTPMEQIALAIELLSPIKDRVLMATAGNHENRSYRTDGLDITAMIMSQLGLKDRYCREGGMLFLKFGEQTKHSARNTANPHIKLQTLYAIYATHGSGGGRKEGAKAIRLADMASIVDADIYIHSHTHLPFLMKQAFYRTDMSNSGVKMVDKLFVNSSAKLKYGGYGQTYEFKPASTASPIIHLNGEYKAFTANL